MSLFNALCGTTPGCEALLAALGLNVRDVGRFRDCFLNEMLEIVVYTRNGGGNRDEFQPVLDRLKQHPLFLRDYDDDFDCTFAYYVFSAPTEIRKEDWQQIYEETTKAVGTPRERFARIMGKLGDSGTPKDDPELANALQVGKRILEPIKEMLSKADRSKGTISVTEIHADGSVSSHGESV